MTLFDPAQVQGNSMQVARTHPQHLSGRRDLVPAPVEESSFRSALIGSLEEVNGHQTAHEALSLQAVVNPDSVEAHDLTIAAARANTSLSITRNIVDRVIQAYRDITNLR